MRKIVLSMMTTLNGRLDDPDAWMVGVSQDHAQEIDRGYAGFDTILAGRTTAEEMAEYWPAALADAGVGESATLAEQMHSYQKWIFTTDPAWTIDWHNAEPVVVTSDDAIRSFVRELRTQPGDDIHLSGGARLAQTFVRLGLVDEYRLFAHPVYSAGESWFGQLDGQQSLELVSSTSFENGVVASFYRPA